MIKKTLVAIAIALSTSAFADAYPDRPIEIIVPYSAGGGTDVLARTLAKNLQKQFPKGVLVVNKTGASGTIGLAYLLNQKADGYTLAIIGPDLILGPHLNTTTHTYKDTTPIAMLNADPLALIVRTNSPFNTVDDFVAHAKKNPGAVTVGGAGTNSVNDLNTTVFENKTGTKFNHIPYQGSAPAVLAVVAEQIDAVVTTPAEVLPWTSSGKLKILYAMNDRKVYRGIIGPKNLPPEILAQLKTSIATIVKDPEFQDAMKKLNMELVYLDDQEFTKFLAADDQVYYKMFKK